jgi:hypothetical protein
MGEDGHVPMLEELVESTGVIKMTMGEDDGRWFCSRTETLLCGKANS